MCPSTTNITSPSCSQRLTTEDLRRNCPEVADDFTQEEIDGWIRSSKDYFDALNRDNLQRSPTRWYWLCGKRTRGRGTQRR
ncbi:hypothetical protein MRX96_043912 [Rhipicephalus microplus]